MIRLLFFFKRIYYHIKNDGVRSFINEGMRRVATIFYEHNQSILHETYLSCNDIPDLISQYNIDIDVHLAGKEDLERLKGLVRLREIDVLKKRVRDNKQAIVGYNKSGDMRGYLWISEGDEYIEELGINIDSTYIYDGLTFKEFKGRGVMVGILQRVLEYLKENKKDYVVVLTKPDNKPVIKVISRLGFRPVKQFEYKRVLFFSSLREKRYDTCHMINS